MSEPISFWNTLYDPTRSTAPQSVAMHETPPRSPRGTTLSSSTRRVAKPLPGKTGSGMGLGKGAGAAPATAATAALNATTAPAAPVAMAPQPATTAKTSSSSSAPPAAPPPSSSSSAPAKTLPLGSAAAVTTSLVHHPQQRSDRLVAFLSTLVTYPFMFLLTKEAAAASASQMSGVAGGLGIDTRKRLADFPEGAALLELERCVWVCCDTLTAFMGTTVT